MRNLVENGEYFKQARIWYNQIFISPYILRSTSLVVCIAFITALSLTALNINFLFPLNTQIGYAVDLEDTTDYNAKINNADYYGDNVFYSISKIFIETYIDIRESYNYSNLASNMLFLQRTSTKPVYNKYNDYINIDNPDSPVLSLENNATKNVSISSVNFISNERVIVKFNTESRKNTGKIINNKDWEAEISFLIDEVQKDPKPGAPFSFTVTDYKVKLIRENNVS